MNTVDKAPQQFLDYVMKHGIQTGKTWTLKWSDAIVRDGMATVTEVDPGVYNMTAEHDFAVLPKLRMDQGTFRRQVTDDDVTEWWVVDSGSVTSKTLFNYFNQMRHAVAATKPC